jgi:hypothetical protein
MPLSRPMQGPINPSQHVGLDYLTGTDVPGELMECSFTLLRFVVPEKKSLSPLVAEITETYGKHYWGLNVSNIRKLAALGFSDFQMLNNRKINCIIDYQPNPQKGNQLSRSLTVAGVE